MFELGGDEGDARGAKSAVFVFDLREFRLDEAFEVGEGLLGVDQYGDWFDVCFLAALHTLH